MMYLFSNKSNGRDRLSDAALAENYKKFFDNASLAELFQRYSDIVYAVCLKYLKNQENCQDAVLEIFAGIAEDLKYRELLDFKSGLYIVATNHCLMKVRLRASCKAVFQGSDRVEELADENAEWKIINQLDEESLNEVL